MAERKLDIVIRAKDLYTKSLSGAVKKFKKAGAVIGKTLKTGAKIGAVAVASLTAVMFKASKMAGIQEDAEKSLEVALGRRSDALLRQASALQKVTKFGDESIISTQAMIGMFIKDEEQIKKATVATLDLATAKGMDLKKAGDLIAKTLGSSTNALSRYGVEVTGAVGSTERLESVTSNIAKVFGGQAQAQATTFAGRMTQLSNATGDVWEELGFAITKSTAFNEIVSLSTKSMAKLGGWINKNRAYLIELAKTGLVGVMKGLTGAVKLVGFLHSSFASVNAIVSKSAVTFADFTHSITKGLNTIGLATDKEVANVGKWAEAKHTNYIKELDDLEGLKTAYKSVVATMRTTTAEVIALDNKQTATAVQNIQKKKQEQSKWDKFRALSEKKHLELASGTAGSLATIMQATSKMQGREGKKAFETMKSFQIAQAIINTYSSAVAAYNSLVGTPFVGPVLGGIAAAGAIASGMMQVDAIRNTSFQGQAHGGLDFVPKTGTYLLEKGEKVVKKADAQSQTGTTNINFNIIANDTRGFDSLLQSRRGQIINIIRSAYLEQGVRAGI